MGRHVLEHLRVLHQKFTVVLLFSEQPERIKISLFGIL